MYITPLSNPPNSTDCLAIAHSVWHIWDFPEPNSPLNSVTACVSIPPNNSSSNALEPVEHRSIDFLHKFDTLGYCFLHKNYIQFLKTNPLHPLIFMSYFLGVWSAMNLMCHKIKHLVRQGLTDKKSKDFILF